MLALAQVKTAATILPRRVSLATILMPAVLSRAIKSWIRRESPVSLRTCSHEGPRPRPPLFILARFAGFGTIAPCVVPAAALAR